MKPQIEKPWSETEQTILCAMGYRGCTAQHIACVLGRSVSSVQRHAIAHGLELPTRRAWTKNDLAQLGTMSDQQLAARIHATRYQVQRARLKRGIPPYRQKQYPALQLSRGQNGEAAAPNHLDIEISNIEQPPQPDLQQNTAPPNSNTDRSGLRELPRFFADCRTLMNH